MASIKKLLMAMADAEGHSQAIASIANNPDYTPEQKRAAIRAIIERMPK